MIMGIMIICLGAYLSISYAGTVYPQMDATVLPSPALMYFYKVHEIGQNFWIFICILVILPNLESSKYLDRRVSGFNHFMIQRIGKRKTCLLSFGKNIVKVLLENYGYEVIDLGKDVPAEVIVDTAIKRDVPLVGLSALMTTTVVHMEETIRLLRERAPEKKVVVGGAVLTPEYAKRIGADCYAKDAMATVHYAEQVFGGMIS